MLRLRGTKITIRPKKSNEGFKIIYGDTKLSISNGINTSVNISRYVWTNILFVFFSCNLVPTFNNVCLIFYQHNITAKLGLNEVKDNVSIFYVFFNLIWFS